MITICISNLKGGVGKTTTSVNLSYTLSMMGKKVLVIDLDPQCNCTRFFAKVNQTGYTVSQLFQSPQKIKQMIYRTKYKNLDVIRGNSDIKVESIELLKSALSLVQEKYEYCIIDTRPVFDTLTQNAVYAADVMLTPIKFDNYCRDNLALVEAFFDTFSATYKPELKWFVFANMSADLKAQKKIMRDIIYKHNYPILDVCVRKTTVVDNALALYKPVARHKNKSGVAQDYSDLALEIMSWEDR